MSFDRPLSRISSRDDVPSRMPSPARSITPLPVLSSRAPSPAPSSRVPSPAPSLKPSQVPAGHLSPPPSLPGEVTTIVHVVEKKKIPVGIDPDFYLQSVFVVFQVENCLFRVPTYLFVKESQYFVKKFGLPLFQNDDGKGSSPTNPIVIDSECSREDFRNLLKALYPLSVSLTLSLSELEWKSVLKLSTEWHFIDLRKMAISELERMSVLRDIDRIFMGRQYSISSWVISGLEGIAQRGDTITDEEVIIMNYMTAVKLFRIRELNLKGNLWMGVRTQVEEVFIDEIATLRLDEDTFKTPHAEMKFTEPSFFEAIPDDGSPGGAQCSVVDGLECVQKPLAIIEGGSTLKKKKKKK